MTKKRRSIDGSGKSGNSSNKNKIFTNASSSIRGDDGLNCCFSMFVSRCHDDQTLVISMKPTMIDRRRYWRSNSRGSQTTQLRSLKVPDEYSQLAERGAEFASRLLLQQNRSYRRQLLVARETLVVPFLSRHVDADRVKGRFHVGFDHRCEITKNKSQRRASYCYVHFVFTLKEIANGTQ